MTNCEVYWELMSCALDGALTDEESRRLEEHLTQCPECRELFVQMQGLQGDMPGVEEAPADFADGVMAGVAGTEQEIPFTNLPQNRDIHKEGRDSLKAWWKPITQWCAIAACFLIICGVGTMANRSGLFSADSTSGASAPSTAVQNQESVIIADEDMMDTSVNEKPAADDGYAEDSEPSCALGDDVQAVAAIEWDGCSYAFTGEEVRDLPEGFSFAGELIPAQSDEVWMIYTGETGVIYVDNGVKYERWEKIEE